MSTHSVFSEIPAHGIQLLGWELDSLAEKLLLLVSKLPAGEMGFSEDAGVWDCQM